MASVVIGRRHFLASSAVLLTSVLAARHTAPPVAGAPALPPPAHAVRRGRFGPLGAPDVNGWLLGEGYTSRVVARSREPIGAMGVAFPDAPDGGGCFPVAGGGWRLAWNSEVGGRGGQVTSITFDADGSVSAAAIVASGLSRPCSGGVTLWGTWLSCEEVSNGIVWEVDPSGVNPAVPRRSMGVFNHEAAAVHAATRTVYLSEDQADGLLYRYRYSAHAQLGSGVLEAALVGSNGVVGWIAVPDPTATTTPCRHQVAATRFNGGEGLALMDDRVLFLTTKGDNRVWSLDLLTQQITVVYDRAANPDAPLAGVDNVAVTPGDDLLVCEDGDNMELVAIEPNGRVAVFARLSGQPGSELTGACLNPQGTRLYVASQRGIDASRGILYEISGPFPW
jgi:secreted PhoX family phosphatase